MTQADGTVRGQADAGVWGYPANTLALAEAVGLPVPAPDDAQGKTLAMLSRDTYVDRYNGDPVALSKLTPLDFLEMARIIWADRRKKLIDNLRELEMSREDILAELAKHDDRPARYTDVLRWLATIEGQTVAVARGYALKHGCTPAAAVAHMADLGVDPKDIGRAALRCCNVEPAPVASGGALPANPPAAVGIA